MSKHGHEEEFSVVMVFGDSITAGGNATARERCWAHELVRQINEYQRRPANLINVGIGANLISTKSPAYPYSGKPAGDERVHKHLLGYMTNGVKQTPDLIVVALCTNDARSGTPIADYCGWLSAMLARIREGLERQCVIVVCGPYHMHNFMPDDPVWGKADSAVLNKYNHAIKTLCETSDCLFVDLLRAMDGADWLIHRDGVHLNDLGHRVVANAIFMKLSTECPGLAKETMEVEKNAVFWRDESKLEE